MYSALLQKIPVAIVALTLIIAVLTICNRSKYVTKGEFIKTLKNTKYIQAWILVFVFVLTMFFGVFNHLKAKQNVKAVITLNYSEASRARNSNGTRYNMSEILCDEVLSRAIEMGALENISAKTLKKSLSLYPYVQGDVTDESEYHISTEFVVAYNATKDTQHLDPKNVVQLIANAYKEYYIEKYTDNYSMVAQQKQHDYSSLEYMDIVTYLNKEVNFVLNYLYGMAQNSYSFVTSDGKTFQSIASQVYQFQTTQINQNLWSLILQNGVAKDKSGYIDRLNYHNNNTNFTLQKNAASFDLCNEAVSMYAEEMTRIVLVPTWDESGKYYMGRTKVGIDELSVMATAFSDKVASNQKEIMDLELIIDKMESVTSNSKVYKEADELIATVDRSIAEFTKEAINAGREYSSYRMNQCIATRISGVSLFAELKQIAVFACLAYVAAIALSISKKFPKRKA